MRISERRYYIDMSGRRVYISRRDKVGADKFWTYAGYQVDRNGVQIGDWRGWKSDGRDWAGDMGGHIIREADVGMSIDDECAAVLERLVEAMETDLAMPVRVGPKMYGNSMPDYIHDEDAIAQMEREEMRDWKTDRTRQRHQAINDKTARQAKCSRARIGRMEEALQWPGLIFDETDRRILVAFCLVKARGWEWGRYLEQHNRRQTKENCWIKRTTYRKITKSLQEIAQKLRKHEIILRDCAGLQVAHHEAETSCNSINSDC